MDEFQATTGHELTEARSKSAQRYGDALLTEAVRLLSTVGGKQAIEQLRSSAAGKISEHPDHRGKGDLLGRIALEEIERVIQLATVDKTRLRGWTEDAPPAIEEQKNDQHSSTLIQNGE